MSENSISFKIYNSTTRKIREVLDALITFHPTHISIIKEYYIDDEFESKIGTEHVDDLYVKFSYIIFKKSISFIEIASRYPDDNFDNLVWEVEIYLMDGQSLCAGFSKETEAIELSNKILEWVTQ